MSAILAWLAAWWPTILICLGLAVLVVLLVRNLIRDKQRGKSCCGGCGGCAMNGVCHTRQETSSEASIGASDDQAKE